MRYRYRSYGTGPYTTKIAYYSDDFENETIQWWADSFDYNVPYSSSPSWRTVYYHGPVYAIDDTPAVMFSSEHPQSNCIAISSDTPNQGYSYFLNEVALYLDAAYEYIVDLMYEEISVLSLDNSQTGDISGTDYLDAYFIGLSAGEDYEFKIERTSGMGDLKMRLIEYEPLTTSELQNNSGGVYPRIMSYNPSVSNTYVLLIEPNQYGVDFAQYSIVITEVSNGSPGPPGQMLDVRILYLIIIIAIISIVLGGGFFFLRKRVKAKGTIPSDVETATEADLLVPFVESPKNVFISYSTLDSAYFNIPKIVEELKKYPEIEKVLYWEADSSANIVEYMEETLSKCNTFLLFCTENTKKSNAVKDEWHAAFQLRKKDLMKIIPIYEDEDFIPNLLMPLLNVKYSAETFDEFIKNLSREISR